MAADMNLVRSALAAVAACHIHAALAQHALEIIPLRHSTVDQVLPTLRPLLEPGATISGQSNQLILRASPGNIAEIRQVLDTIDRPRRRLQISVRFDESGTSAEQGMDAGGRVSNRGARIEVQIRDAHGDSRERVDQRVQVLEGSRAFISNGQSRVVPQRQVIQTPGGVVAQDSYLVQDAATGFDVSPRLSGSRVLLDIAPQRSTFSGSPVPGGMQSQAVVTTLSAALGEWVEIGGADSRAERDDRGLASVNRARMSSSRKVWVKVEEIAEGSRSKEGSRN